MGVVGIRIVRKKLPRKMMVFLLGLKNMVRLRDLEVRVIFIKYFISE